MTLNHKLLSLIRCPRCRGNGIAPNGNPPHELHCGNCTTIIPIVNGVPRLVGAAETYAASFGRQWNRYDVIRPDEDEATFAVKTGISAGKLANHVVLDAGCGGGRYARLLGSHGAQAIGVDLSAAVVKAATTCREFRNVLIVQADLLDLPLAERAFDFVYSIGVLHHMPDPRRGFREIARCVKPGGQLAVWLYRRNTFPQEWLNSALRAITTRLPPHVLELLCAALAFGGGVPIVNKTLNKIANFSNHPDRSIRVCDNFDWYAPVYQSHHSVVELKQWFAEEGFADVAELAPAKEGSFYRWAYNHNMIIGSGANVVGTKT
jgi:SAM-dependent methyltransferase